jgi:pilus assembly protein Flp/PilA
LNIFSKAGFTKLSRGERGASAIEYALLVAMVAIAIVAFVDPINAAVTAIFASIQAALT